jgi:membrane associated rhomboid family serine protease
VNPWNLTSSALHEPWRLWTAHFFHKGWADLLVNAWACAIPLAFLSPRSRLRVSAWMLVLMPLISLWMIPFLKQGGFQGASGLACALWACVGLALWRGEAPMVGGVLMTLLGLKLGVECVAALSPWIDIDTHHTIAHGLGTLLGLGLGRMMKFRGSECLNSSSPEKVSRTA